MYIIDIARKQQNKSCKVGMQKTVNNARRGAHYFTTNEQTNK